MSTDRPCPCGRGPGYAGCCGRYHRGAPAPTAEDLMRARYSAFAVGDPAYLLATWHPRTRPDTVELDPAMRWTSLTVHETVRGGPGDPTGVVAFTAAYREGGRPGELRERSRFVRHDGAWTYTGPLAPAPRVC